MSDLLDGFVSKFVPYLPQEDDSRSGQKETISASGGMVVKEPVGGSEVVSVLSTAMKDRRNPGSEIKQLFLALCHRCHSRILLLDGYYATTGTDETPLSTFSSNAASAGDTMRVSTHPSPGLVFDSTKCADSIAILSDSAGGNGGNGSSVHQRASKVWGTVLSTRQYSPKTGVHRWAVRLDKCERGHVFIGLATSQGSMRTYVGGDKYGWGMIGTQALWHDRRKVRLRFGRRKGILIR